MTDKAIKKGRPLKGETKGETVGVRLTTDIIAGLDRITEEESRRTGYRLDRVQIIRRAISELLDRENHD